MAGENIKIQTQIVPLAPRRDEKTTETRGGRRFELRERTDSADRRGDFAEDRQDRTNPSLTDENWLRERTLEELKTIVKAVQLGATDPWQLTDLIFYARHPDMKGVPLTADHQDLLDEWNSVSALLVHPTLNEIKDVIGAQDLIGLVDDRKDLDEAFANASRFKINAGSLNTYTSRYDNVIANAVEWCPGLSPAVLKSLIAQESKFNATVINSYGYAGIAQFGRPAAREVGLNVGIAGSASDERLDPSKAIPGAARLLNIKAKRLGEIAFSRYGQPDGIEFWKFVTAAYNGGEGTVAVAMGHAYRSGLAQARANNLVGVEAVSFARRYASKWENLKIGGTDSPLGLAAARFFPNIAVQKYHEIGNYPSQIMARVAGTFR
ncbi:MAG: transglycosylase SLT domain-containing protein [Acidobacteria bacterium]|jgi:soluble lytic murein transglycosylase-like protein|nr:transglycosylase SLT domain-containing protein [Acidobacteriota bacterium]